MRQEFLHSQAFLAKLYTSRLLSRAAWPFNPLIKKMSSIAKLTYNDIETAEINQWLTTSNRLKISSPADQLPLLNTLNSHLATRTTLLGVKPSQADTALYEALAKVVSTWTPEQRTGENGHPHIVRHLDFVQNSPIFDLNVDDSEKIKFDPEEILHVKPLVDAKAEKERLKKEKAAAEQGNETKPLATSTIAHREKQAEKPETAKKVAGENSQVQKKKEKPAKAPKAPAAAPPLSPSLIDLRVGHILKAICHPEAESLYVSTIAMGDKPGTDDTSEYEGQIVRTVCSGLKGLVPLEEMQGRKVVVVCNLKPVKMRGIKSAAMVLAASPRLKEGEEDHHAGPVELVTPPESAAAGEKVFFEGWKGEPERVLNPKKKVWETIQPGFTTTDILEVGFDPAAVPALSKVGETSMTERLGKLVTESGGICKVKSLKGAIVR